MSKFASLTSTLLVRKGEAAPSTVTPLRDDRPMVIPVAKNDPGPPVAAAKPRRIVLNVSPPDYERLGLIAVKRGLTRHGLAAEAMALYFDRLAGEYACACIGGCREACAAE